jgi:hypothetical protein
MLVKGSGAERQSVYSLPDKQTRNGNSTVSNTQKKTNRDADLNIGGRSIQ